MEKLEKNITCNTFGLRKASYQELGVVGCGKGVVYLASWVVQLILAYSWARPAILVAGKGGGGSFYFYCFFTFISVPLSSLSLYFISFTISSISFLPFSGRWHKMTHKGWRVISSNTVNYQELWFLKKKQALCVPHCSISNSTTTVLLRNKKSICQGTIRALN